MIPQITIQPNAPTLLVELIHAAHRYYPIGFELENEQYDGFKEAIEIVDQKISSLVNGSLPENLLNLETDIRSLFSDLTVTDEYAIQFPNYAFGVALSEEDFPNLRRAILLRIRISLLTKHYTYFYEEHITHKAFKASGSLVNTTVVSSYLNGNEHNPGLLSQLRNMIEESFPGYSYANHDLLFQTKIEYGTPFGEIAIPIHKYYSLYQFLFDCVTFSGLQVAK